VRRVLSAGVLYFVSCTVNPILYNVMSHRFRQAFVETICGAHRRDSRAGDGHTTQYAATHRQMAPVVPHRARGRSVSTEMMPSPQQQRHQQQQQQQQLLMSSVYVDDAGKMTVQQ